MTAAKKKSRANTAAPRKKAAAKKPAAETAPIARSIAEEIPAMLEAPRRKKGFWARFFGL